MTTFFIFRFEQSIAEATKIAKIREELDKLDQELAVDVEILRKEIEAVSVQYTNTRLVLEHFCFAAFWTLCVIVKWLGA